MDFKVGDRVRLTGELWGTDPRDPEHGSIVTVKYVDSDGDAWFTQDEIDWYIESEGDYTGEVVGPTPPKGRSGISRPTNTPIGLSPESVRTLAEVINKSITVGPPETNFEAGIRNAEDAVTRVETAQAESRFKRDLDEVLAEIRKILVAKNTAYGDSALNPVRIFSKADAVEQLKVRLDDKISRLQRGENTDEVPEDTETDLIGYLLLLKIARKR